MRDNRTYADRREYNIAHMKKRRKQLKLMAVQHMGGKCMRCGYNRYSEVLEFHHKDPSKKEFGLGMGGLTRSWKKTIEEAEKCELLCANCHREKHVEEKNKLPQAQLKEINFPQTHLQL